MALTAKEVANAKSTETKAKLADGEGMYLYIWPNGAKYWRLKYRFAGKEKVLALGTYPKVSLADARIARSEAKNKIRQGIDPTAHKKKIKQEIVESQTNNFRAAAEDYFKTYKGKWDNKHRLKMWRRLEIHIFHDLGERPLNEIKRMELLGVIRKVEAQSTHLSGRVLQLCKAIFSHAVLNEKIENNPATDLTKALAPHKTKNYPSLKPNEIKQFVADLELAKTTPIYRLMVKFLLLTFVRQQELRMAHWSDMDFNAKIWRIRAETMKMKEEHLVPLSKQAIRILHQIQEINGNRKFVFQAQKLSKSEVISAGTINMLLKRMGYKDRLVAHGFRSIASTVLNESGGYRPDVIERQLAHSERDDVRAAYNRAEYLDARKEMMQWWADHLVEQGLKI